MANLFRCGGGRSEASYQNLMDQLIEETVTGPIASFTDGANNIPAKEIICHINPTETGTGEKSPQNPYVIGGFTEANITQQSTIPVTDNAPYLFRQSGGDNNADVYNQETDKLVGASAVVNQLVDTGATEVPTISGHKYLTRINSVVTIQQGTGTAISINDADEDNAHDLTAMFGTAIADYVYSLEQATAGSGIAYLRKYGFFTKDYYPYTANTLQSVNTSKHTMVGKNRFTGNGEKFYLAPNVTYYISSSERETAGRFTFRAYDKDDNVVPVTMKTGITSGMYYDTTYKSVRNAGDTKYQHYQFGYTNTDIAYFQTTTGSLEYPNLQIEAGSTATEYEPYIKHEYALPNIDLRGLYKLDANNNLYADGDTLESDGTLTRKYGIVDLGSLNYKYQLDNQRFKATINDMNNTNIARSLYLMTPIYECKSNRETYDSSWNNVIYNVGNRQVAVHNHTYTDIDTFTTAMSGIYLLYPLATPTTETVTGFTNPQTVSKYGTEEYTDERDFPLPVGHETIYLPTGQREYTVPFGQTVYGGELVLHEGQNDKLIPWEYIASYNGEAINEPWVSSMDAYAPGTTPTTGAFVCYPAATPSEITLPIKTQVNTLLGANNIYHDCNGDIDVTYRANGALYVQEHPITRALMAARPAEQIQEQEEQQEEKEINKSEDNEK